MKPRYLQIGLDFWSHPKIRKANRAVGSPCAGMVAQELLVWNQVRQRDGLLRAGDIDPDGVAVALANATGTLDEELAQRCIEALAASGWLELTEDGGARITGWGPEYAPTRTPAERKADERARKKAQEDGEAGCHAGDVTCHTDGVTPSRGGRDTQKEPRDNVTPNRTEQNQQNQRNRTEPTDPRICPVPVSPDSVSEEGVSLVMGVLRDCGFGASERERRKRAEEIVAKECPHAVVDLWAYAQAQAEAGAIRDARRWIYKILRNDTKLADALHAYVHKPTQGALSARRRA